MKVNLEIKREEPGPGNHRTTAILKSLPFFQMGPKRYVHRVRSGLVYWRNNTPHHMALKFWCGGIGYPGRGEFLQFPGSNETFCATCEGRAIGTGLYGAPLICGRVVRFSPKL